MSRAPLLVVTGTGTGIGKTHLSSALIQAWAIRLRAKGVAEPKVAAIKPIESGVGFGGRVGPDSEVLREWSTFHVKQFPPPYLLTRALSPHLAARMDGRRIDLSVVIKWVAQIRAQADGVLVELPGGLFSPLSETPARTNADLARALEPTAIVLVAPDRLGVLHDLGALTRAAHVEDLSLSGILLSAPDPGDASTGENAYEVPLVTNVPVLAALPHAPVELLTTTLPLLRALMTLIPSLDFRS
jgi:dethiobiotin synthetase